MKNLRILESKYFIIAFLNPESKLSIISIMFHTSKFLHKIKTLKFLTHYTKKVYRDRKGKVVGSTEVDKYSLSL